MAGTVEAQATPNPNACKFVVGKQLTSAGSSRSYYDAAEAADDDLARELMALPGVRSLFMVSDFITVSKTAGASWDELTPRVTEIIERHL